MVDIKDEASECLNCFNAMCMNACPLHVRIPEINKLVKEGKLDYAFDVAFHDNPLGAICGIVCPHEKQCEGACIKGIKSSSIKIGTIEEYLWNWKLSQKEEKKDKNKNKESSNIKVAVIGGGPAGIACASYLLRNGIDVTIYEKEKFLGGILAYGIPDFRLDTKLVKKNIKFALSYGAKGKLDVKYKHLLVAKGVKERGYKLITMDELQKEFDYVFVAIGLDSSKSLGLTNDNNKDFVINAHSFLKDSYDVNNKRIVVIGGGNVAIDSARKAKKCGADVTIIYRRRLEDMPANKKEIEDATTEGVKFIFTTKVVDIKKEEDLVLTLDSGDTFNTDYLIEAIGSEVNKNYFDENIEFTESNYVKVDDYFKIPGKNIFIGGDLISSNKTVASAVNTGKVVASKIIEQE